MSLRSRLTLAFLAVAFFGVGATGYVLIARSYRSALRQIAEQRTLIAENRAHALADELSLIAAELARLGSMAEVNLADNDMEPEKRLLYFAHKDSAIFNIAIAIFAADGRPLWSEPPRPDLLQAPAAAAPWFEAVRDSAVPVISVGPVGTGAAREVEVALAVRGTHGEFLGAIAGIIDPVQSKLFTEKLSFDLGTSGAAWMVGPAGEVFVRAGEHASATPAREAATRRVLRGERGYEWGDDAAGRQWLVAFAPVGDVGWGLLLRQAKDELDTDLERQLRALALILGGGVFLAVAFGLLFSRVMTRPLRELAATARDIAAGQRAAIAESPRHDEIGDLANALASMTRELTQLASTLEQKVEARTRELSEAQAALVESNRLATIGKTSAAIAHELRNALNGLGMAIDLVASGKAPPDTAQAVRRQVREEIERLRGLTEDLTAFAGPPKLQLAEVDLHDLVRNALSLSSARLAEAGLEPELRLAHGGAPLQVSCDAHKLTGVLINLVKNAVEAVAFAEPGRQVSRRLVVATRIDAGAAVLDVEDGGAGLSADARRHLFEPFFTTKHNGTGLGLAIARKVVEAHGGAIRAGDAPAGGAVFTVTLPLAWARPGPAPAEAREAAAGAD